MKLQSWWLRSAAVSICLVLLLTACGGKNSNEDGQAVDPTNDAEEVVRSWDQPPEMQIDLAKKYVATVHTSEGEFTIELFAEDAPLTVNNFVFLSQQRYYEGVIFHRIMEPFMIQTGDPTGTGMGGPGYQFEDELPSPHQYEVGTVAMANAGPDTNGSQFFICTGQECEYLNMQPFYTIFGKVTEGMDTVEAIAATPVVKDSRGEMSKPEYEVRIERIEISES